MSPNIYAAYRGDEFVAVGTKRELARALGVKLGTVDYYVSPAWRKRASEKAIFVIKVEMEEKEGRTMKLAFYKQMQKICNLGNNPVRYRLLVQRGNLYAFNEYMVIRVNLFHTDPDMWNILQAFDYDALMELYTPMKPSYDLIRPDLFIVPLDEGNPLLNWKPGFLDELVDSAIDSFSGLGNGTYDVRKFQLILDVFKKAGADIKIQSIGGIHAFTGNAHDAEGLYSIEAVLCPFKSNERK